MQPQSKLVPMVMIIIIITSTIVVTSSSLPLTSQNLVLTTPVNMREDMTYINDDDDDDYDYYSVKVNDGDDNDNVIGDETSVTFDNPDLSHHDRRSEVRISRHEIVSGRQDRPGDDDNDDGDDGDDGDDLSRTLHHSEVHSEITKHEIFHKKDPVDAADYEIGVGDDDGEGDDDGGEGDNDDGNDDEGDKDDDDDDGDDTNNCTNNDNDFEGTGAFLGDQGKFVNRSNKSQEKFASDDDDHYSTPQQISSSSPSSSSSSSLSSSSSKISKEIPMKRLPQAIIIGVKKGGTRALLEFLQLHPRVRAPGPEVHFFDKNYAKGLEWYRQQMPSTNSDQITIEKTPSYFVTRDAPVRVHSMSPLVKLIIVVRNPVTRAISDYAQARSKKNDLLTFEELVFQRRDNKVAGEAGIKTNPLSTTNFGDDDDDKGLQLLKSATTNDTTTTNRLFIADKDLWNRSLRERTIGRPQHPQNISHPSAIATNWGAIRIGLYAKHLERWLAYFPMSLIHFVHGERLVVDPAGELALLQDFLGLERFITDRFFYFDAVKGFPCLRVRPNSSYSWPSNDQDLGSTFTSYKQSPALSLSQSSLLEGQKFIFAEGYSKHLMKTSAAGKPGYEFISSESSNHPNDFTSTASSTNSLALNSPSDQPRTHCLGKTKGRAHPSVSPPTMDSLKKFYKPHNERFYRITGTNFGWS